MKKPAVIKKTMKHLSHDMKEAKKGIRDDKKLKKSLRKSKLEKED